MRTAFLGTSEFAATVLSHVAGSAHEPALVITPPPRPRGRGRRVAEPPAAREAHRLGIEVCHTEQIGEAQSRERLGEVDPEAICVCAFGQLIREPLLSWRLMLNIHPSLLPRWRGAAPIERAIMAGDRETGVCVLRLTEDLDAGPLAGCESTPIGESERYGELWPRLAKLGAELLTRTLDEAAAGRLDFAEQDEGLATYAPKIDRAERRLDPARSAVELERTVRALTPHIGAYLELADGSRLGVHAARALPGDGESPGSVSATEDGLLLGSAEGWLAIEEVQPQGKRPMPAEDYLRGHPLPQLAPAAA